MKHLSITLLAALLLSPPIVARAQSSAKDLFYAADEAKPRRTRPRNPGRPGAMVRIELNRNGKLSYVSPKTAFRSGDKVRLHVRINRAGYLTVLNEGTSGHLQLLYPRTLANASARVSPTLDFTVPATPGKWLEFDDRTGTERLHIMLSAQPIPDVVTFLALNSGGGAPVSTAGSTGSSGATADGPAQEQEVVDALNSKAFRGLLDSSSKDFTETGEDQTEQGEVAVFVVTTGANTDLKKPIVYKLALEHGN